MLKDKLYKVVVRPAMMYRSECWALYKKLKQNLSITEMRILRQMCGVTKEDEIRNEHIRDSKEQL